MGKKQLQKGIASLERRIAEHERKIREEQSKANPDQGRIAHLKREIEAFRKGIARKEKRLRKK